MRFGSGEPGVGDRVDRRDDESRRCAPQRAGGPRCLNQRRRRVAAITWDDDAGRSVGRMAALMAPNTALPTRRRPGRGGRGGGNGASVKDAASNPCPLAPRAAWRARNAPPYARSARYLASSPRHELAAVHAVLNSSAYAVSSSASTRRSEGRWGCRSARCGIALNGARTRRVRNRMSNAMSSGSSWETHDATGAARVPYSWQPRDATNPASAKAWPRSASLRGRAATAAMPSCPGRGAIPSSRLPW